MTMKRMASGMLAVLLAVLIAAAPALAETVENDVPPEDLSILTKYITLTYPADYADAVTIEVAEQPEECRITACATLEDKALELFSILLTEKAAEGFKLGTLQAEESGAVGVYLFMNEQQPQDWTEEAYQQINTWQESINFLLMQLHEHTGFTPGA